MTVNNKCLVTWDILCPMLLQNLNLEARQWKSRNILCSVVEEQTRHLESLSSKSERAKRAATLLSVDRNDTKHTDDAPTSVMAKRCRKNCPLRNEMLLINSARSRSLASKQTASHMVKHFFFFFLYKKHRNDLSDSFCQGVVHSLWVSHQALAWPPHKY